MILPRFVRESTLTNLTTYQTVQTHLVTMNEVDLAVEFITSSGTVATKPDFDVKTVTKGTLFNCISFVILFKQTLL